MIKTSFTHFLTVKPSINSEDGEESKPFHFREPSLDWVLNDVTERPTHLGKGLLNCLYMGLAGVCIDGAY
jgi:hypothetical protein